MISVISFSCVFQDDSFADDPDLKDKVYVHIPAIIVATFGLVGRQKRQKCIYLIKFRWLWQQVGVLLVALGCCGGFKESRVLLIIYIVLIVAVLLLVNISIFLNVFLIK